MNYWKIYLKQIKDIEIFKRNLVISKPYLTETGFGYSFHEGLVKIHGGLLGNGKTHYPFKERLYTPEYILNRISDIHFEESLDENTIFYNEDDILNLIYSSQVSSGLSFYKKELKKIEDSFDLGKKYIVGKEKKEIISFDEFLSFIGISN